MTAVRNGPNAGRSRYASVAIALHWLIALAIVAQVTVAWRMGGPRTPDNFALLQLHKSIGVTILVLSILRLGWRLTNPPPPEPPGLARWEIVLSQIVHWGFYVIMIGMPLTGWLMVSTSRIQIPTLLYGQVLWPNIPGIEGLDHATRKLAHSVGENGHGLLAWGFYALFVLHVAGALKHQLFERDTPVLSRMAPGAVAGRWWDPRLLLIVLVVAGAAAFGTLVQPPHPAQGPPPAAAEPATPAAEAPPAAISAAAPSAGAAAAAPAAPPSTEPVAWKVAPGSALTFATSWGGDPVQGRFDTWKADILFAPEALDKSKVTVTIDMASAKTGDAQRDASLPAADWFDTATHPKAVFTATKFQKTGADRYVAHGALELRGVKKPVDLPFRLTIADGKARMSGDASPDRTAFGVGQGEFTATDQIPAKVSVHVQLTATSDKR
ncbi:cytochrome b/b6 domain-containing protein [Phenylobacterium sp.]|uniref:cytochrome b/b6 domain-containing protein n=1 Tax=Phenylobacterium sp. TaxID=1871053 RepID=UPI00356AABA2